jgi:hypothetical protein
VAAMIENEQQYYVTKAQMQRFEETLVNFANDAEDKRQENPLLFETQVSALESQLADLREELAEYEARTAYSNNKLFVRESQIMDITARNKSMEVKISEKLKTIEEVIQNLIEKIISPTFISTSPIIGGFIFLIYFFSIGYIPDLEINSVTVLLGASAITGIPIYIIFTVIFISPGILYERLISIDGQLQKLLISEKQSQIVGFTRLSLAPIILIIASYIWSFNDLWWVYKILITLVFILIEFIIFYTLCKGEITPYKFFMLIGLACSSYVSLIFATIMIGLIVLSDKINNDSSPNENLWIIVAIIVVIVLVNKIVSSEVNLSQNVSKITKYSLLALVTLMLTTAQLGGLTTIPKRIFEIYGWRNVRNASLVVNYEGCQTLKKVEIKITSEQCTKSKDFYRIDSLQILSGIGKNYFLRYPKVDLTQKNNSKQIAQKNSSKPKNGAKSDAAQPEKFVDFTFPASSIKSWSRKQ